ncbi:hypothetical protein COU60_05065 [Candidatus Pacearchaeota archaeon CG10_big_fil_rev_8_21_14_0_10_34_76]|nr:MAG: hypothetical protein COU60_05065 [Candidatus Pacearchaeota archaeon CG10_big_fil_rev_8_21_14_0_10_34_76]
MNHQKSAIQKIIGPCVILAGAGTGKTYTIVEKIKYLLEKGTHHPEKIVCLTFSNEAANSLTERVIKKTNSERQPIIKTFHSFSSDVIRKYGHRIGIPEKFHILLPDDAKILLHKNFQISSYPCNRYVGEIGIAKDLGISPDDLEEYLSKANPEPLENLEKLYETLNFKFQTLYLKDKNKEKFQLKNQIEKLENLIKMKKFLNTWKAYEKLKARKGYQDYSDLTKNALILLNKYPEIAKEFEYVIVDEFQDTNKLQCDLLEKLAHNNNITVVGDLNQSIYRFRGAYKDNLDQFRRFFNVKKEDIFPLDKSYRSTDKILEVAHTLVKNNYKNEEDCFPVYSHDNNPGKNPEVIELINGNEEVRKIVEILKSELILGVPEEEICIMFRTHQQANLLKKQLEYEGIPFTAITKKSLFKTIPIKKTIDYMVILNHIKNRLKGGEQAWWDLAFNSGLSKEDSIVIARYLKENKNSEEPVLSIRLLNNLDKLNISEEGKIKTHLILKTIKSLLPEIEKPIPEIILKIYEILGLNSPENSNFKEQTLILQRFHSVAQEHYEIEQSTLSDFIHHLEIMKTLNIEIESPEIEKKGVRIMTNHATKGLEYNTIIVSNLAQKRFPMESLNNSLIPSEITPELKEILSEIHDEYQKKEIIKKHQQENQIAEERRLCYVAFTRAKRNLILTFARQYGNKKFLPSQFLNEINYKQNPNITFTQDLSEKYQKPEIKTAEEINKETSSEEMLKNIVFSPSALQIFDQCQKKYQYKYLYHMPESEPISWDAIKLGSFTHTVFERGIRANYRTEKEFLDLARIFQMQDDWNFIDLNEAIPIIRVFFERNKDKYNQKSKTEIKLKLKLENFNFIGYADRIDINDKNELEIIDYKTGSTTIPPKYRNWQLGFYALASKSMGIPKRLTLDMLKKEKPLEFLLDEKGNATEMHSGRMSFSLEEVKQELIDTAKQIISAYETGFKPCSPEKNCSFCNEWVW